MAKRNPNRTLHPKTYKSWEGMRTRCLNPANPQYSNYGGRGITVAPAWSDFSTFLKDMGPRPEGMSIDRIDNDKGYSPENCRWATNTEQANNTRRNRFVTYDGLTLTVSQWALRLQVCKYALSDRLRRNWTFENAIETPISPLKKYRKRRA